MNLGYCMNCRYFCKSDFNISFRKSGGRLAFALYGCQCTFVTRFQNLHDAIPKGMTRVEFLMLSGRRQFELLKDHITGIEDLSEICPWKTEIMISQWNEEKEKNES